MIHPGPVMLKRFIALLLIPSLLISETGTEGIGAPVQHKKSVSRFSSLVSRYPLEPLTRNQEPETRNVPFDEDIYGRTALSRPLYRSPEASSNRRDGADYEDIYERTALAPEALANYKHTIEPNQRKMEAGLDRIEVLATQETAYPPSNILWKVNASQPVTSEPPQRTLWMRLIDVQQLGLGQDIDMVVLDHGERLSIAYIHRATGTTLFTLNLRAHDTPDELYLYTSQIRLSQIWPDDQERHEIEAHFFETLFDFLAHRGFRRLYATPVPDVDHTPLRGFGFTQRTGEYLVAELRQRRQTPVGMMPDTRWAWEFNKRIVELESLKGLRHFWKRRALRRALWNIVTQRVPRHETKIFFAAMIDEISEAFTPFVNSPHLFRSLGRDNMDSQFHEMLGRFHTELGKIHEKYKAQWKAKHPNVLVGQTWVGATLYSDFLEKSFDAMAIALCRPYQDAIATAQEQKEPIIHLFEVGKAAATAVTDVHIRINRKNYPKRPVAMMPPTMATDAVSSEGRWGSATEINRYILPLFLSGSFLGNVGVGIAAVAQAWLVFHITHSTFYSGLDAAVSTSAFLIFSIPGGKSADRWGRWHLLGIQIFRMIPPLILGFLTMSHHTPIAVIITLSFISGIGAAFSSPLYQKVMGALNGGRTRTLAVGLNQIQTNMGRSIGPLAGGLILSHVGTSISYLACVAGLGFFVLALTGVPRLSSNQKPAAKDSALEPFLLRPFAVVLLTSVVGYPLIALLPAFLNTVHYQGPLWLGALTGCFYVGSATGSFLWNRLAKSGNSGKYFVASVGVLGVSLMLFALIQSAFVSTAAILFAGLSFAWSNLIVNNLIHIQVHEEKKGRMFSYFYLCNNGGMAIGNLLFGWIASRLRVPETLFLESLILIASTIILHCRYLDMRHMGQDPEFKDTLQVARQRWIAEST